jgi:SecD/SecF fusion protein
MRNRIYIDFMGYRWWLLGISACLILLSLGAIAVRGLNFGIEFKGGTVVEVKAVGAAASPDSIRIELAKNKVADAVVQAERDPSTGKVSGYLIRMPVDDPAVANKAVVASLKAVKVPSDQLSATTIGPGWGATVTNSAILALIISLLAILIYVSIRFEYKMSVTAVIALFHDVIIVLGIYALTGRELTPNTIAALLAILGYSLYDTIVVFHRIRENTGHLVKQSFMQMANDSINQVLVRSLNTSLTSVIPPLMLLFFGGDTLKDFAFALTIGLISGAYSSVAVASPLYTMWKEREPKYQALKKKFEARDKNPGAAKV